MKDFVDIIMPVYNRENIISKAIESVINQTYGNWHLYIIDDKSENNVKSVILDYSNKDFRIHYVYNEGTKGVSGARNYGLKFCTSEYISFLDSDDEWLPNHLEESLYYLKEKNLDAVFSLWSYSINNKIISINEMSHCLEKIDENAPSICQENTEEFSLFNKLFYSENILKPIFFYHLNTLVLKNYKLKEAGKFDEKLKTSEDMDFIYRIFYFCKFGLIKSNHYLYKDGDDNLYNQKGRIGKKIEEIFNDKLLLNKMLIEGLFKNKMRKKRYYFVLCHNIPQKKKCLEKIINSIYKKNYFLLLAAKILGNKILVYKYLFKSIRLSKPILSIRNIHMILSKKKSLDKKSTYLDLS